jgi:hypothetical protein
MTSSLENDETDLHQINKTLIIMKKITPQYKLMSKAIKNFLASILQIREKLLLFMIKLINTSTVVSIRLIWYMIYYCIKYSIWTFAPDDVSTLT